MENLSHGSNGKLHTYSAYDIDKSFAINSVRCATVDNCEFTRGTLGQS